MKRELDPGNRPTLGGGRQLEVLPVAVEMAQAGLGVQSKKFAKADAAMSAGQRFGRTREAGAPTGHAPASATANSQLAFHPDHSMRADQGPPPTLLAITDKVTSADTLGLKLELTKARTINLDRQEGRNDPAAREA